MSFDVYLNEKYKQIAKTPELRAALVEDHIKRRAPYSPLNIDEKTVDIIGKNTF